MTSKELNEILNKTRRTPDISLTPKQVKELIKDLEQKELLEIELKLEKDKVKYLIKMVSEDTGNHTYIRLYEVEVKKLLEEWLNGKD